MTWARLREQRFRRRAARLIARSLFTNGMGERADRLVLVQEPAPPGRTRDLGGLCEAAVRDHVERALAALAPGD